jgi:hypothetical protein
MAYTGVTLLCGGSIACNPVVVTAEYSNAHYTALTGSGTSWNQTYYAGTFVKQVGAGHLGGGSVFNPNYAVGAPDGNSAELRATSSGASAYIVGSFGRLANGTLAIKGSSLVPTSYVQVYVSADNNTWGSPVYTGFWTNGALNWIPISSLTKIQFVKIVASFGTQSSDINVDSISLYMGSYVQSQPPCPGSGCGSAGTGSYNHPTWIIGLPDSQLTELRAPNAGDNAWIVGNFGTAYSGKVVLDGYSYNNGGGLYNTFVTLDVSTDLLNWRQSVSFTISASPTNAPVWIDITGYLPWNVQYVRVTVTDVPLTGQPGDLYLDAIYIA